MIKYRFQLRICVFARPNNEGQRPSRTRRKGIADARIENTLSRRTQAEHKQCNLWQGTVSKKHQAKFTRHSVNEGGHRRSPLRQQGDI